MENEENSGLEVPERTTASSTGGELGTLREILFGAIHRELERRLNRVDSRLTARGNEIERDFRRRIDALEAHLGAETEALGKSLERGLLETSDSMRARTRDHRESITALEQRLAKVEEAITHAQRELRQQIFEQSKSFIDEVQRLRGELADAIEGELPEEPAHASEGPVTH
jgi:hypothetical protein